MEIEIVGCTPATPEGVCDACSGDGMLEECRPEGLRVVFCPSCQGRGGTDAAAVAKARAFSAAYKEALCG